MQILDKGRKVLGLIAAAALWSICVDAVASDKAPDWMQALKSMPVPEHREKDDSVCMYSEKILTVKPDGKMSVLVREAFKILRPDSPHGVVRIFFDDQTKIDDLHAWSIPAQGKDYAVKDKDAAIVSAGDGSVLVSDEKFKVLQIPAADPGALVGYEYELDERPYFQQDSWDFQSSVPVREAIYTLQLPTGWSYTPIWRNHEAVEATSVGQNRWQWTMRDLKGVKVEDEMPPFNSLAQRLLIRLKPVAGQGKVVESWRDLGDWYLDLTKAHRDASPAIKQTVKDITEKRTTSLGKIQALALFAQSNIRYVAIELGIGGYQPHFAADILGNRYGDCKDKATLLSAMLREVGIESYYVIINAYHGVVPPDAQPAASWFNHAILAIQLPAGINDPSLLATIQHPTLGNILFFDPTNEFIPLGQLPGYLQGNYAMLVHQDGSELVKLPVLSPSTSGVMRTAKLNLDDKGTLSGEVISRALGHTSFERRSTLQRITSDAEKTKFLERSLANSFSSFRVLDYKINNQSDILQPLEYKYSFEAPKYAKATADMLIVRPRILESYSSGLLEKDEKRENPVQFVSLEKNTDEFVVTLPSGYVADDLPGPTDIDYPFGSYHSKTTVSGNTLRYTRTFEIKEFVVPVDKLDDLKKFYRQIYGDERANAVLIKK